jgi:hypothetical protein
MNIFIDISSKNLIQAFTNTQVVGPLSPTFYENDIPDIYVQFIRPNTSSISTIPWTIYDPTTEHNKVTMSLTIGCPINGASSYQVDQQTASFDPINIVFSGSLNLTGSMTQQLIIAGSQSYFEVQESSYDTGGNPVIITWCQKDVSLLPNV